MNPSQRKELRHIQDPLWHESCCFRWFLSSITSPWRRGEEETCSFSPSTEEDTVWDLASQWQTPHHRLALARIGRHKYLELSLKRSFNRKLFFIIISHQNMQTSSFMRSFRMGSQGSGCMWPPSPRLKESSEIPDPIHLLPSV